jgi:hypothetical protein
MSTLTAQGPATRQLAVDRGQAVTTGAALISGPLLLIVGNLLSTPGDTASTKYLTALAGSSSREQLSIICFLLGFTMFIPAAFGLRAMLPGRGRVLGAVGAWLVAFGAMAYAGLVCSGIANIGLAQSLPADQAAHVVSQIESVGAAGVVFLLGLGLPIGAILSISALRRARMTALWVPIVVALGFIVVMLVESTAGGMAADALMLAGLGYIGTRLITGAANPPPEA